MKKINLVIVIFICIWALSSCKKKVATTTTETASPAANNTATVETKTDTSFQVTREALAATFAITDLEMIGAFLGENIFGNNFYSPLPPGSPGATGTVAIIKDSAARYLIMAFNNTTCQDGKLRDGSAFFNYQYNPAKFPNQQSGAAFYHDAGWAHELTISGYTVGSYYIEALDAAVPVQVYSNLTDKNFDPSTTQLSWTIKGKLKITNLADNSKVTTWDGKLTKTLVNSTDPQVFPPSKTAAINWARAVVYYSGSVTGSVGIVPYTINSSSRPMLRDFSCAPFAGVSNTGFHPFINGLATCTAGLEQKLVFFNTQVTGDAVVCDNKGEIVTYGKSYPVTFIR